MQRIITFCEEQHMLEEGDGIILGLSGGADSVCLLMAFLELRRKWRLKILAVHVHHGIRGEHADRDAAFARSLCERHQVEYVEERVDIPQMAKEQQMSEEEAGRHARYHCFYRLLVERGCQKIAVAHHKNDQAETMLFHMARGTGIDGLTGMRPVSGKVIRPLLVVSRQEIEHILAERGVGYCSDATNADIAYTRNYIRHEVIPRMEYVNAEAVSHIAALADKLWAAQDYLQDNIESAFLACRSGGRKTGVTLDLPEFIGLHSYMKQAVIRRTFEELSHSLKDIGEVHVKAVLQLTESQPGRRCMLPYGIMVWRGAGELYFQRDTGEPVAGDTVIKTTCSDVSQTERAESACVICVGTMETGRLYTFLAQDAVITARVTEEKPEIFGKKNYTKYFDCDKIKDNLVLRHPEPEDYLVIDSEGHKKKLNRYFVDEKVPVYVRGSQIVLAEGHHILWVPGYRMSEAYKVTKETGGVLELSFKLQTEEGEVHDRED